MKKSEREELRTKTIEELQDMIKEAREELLKGRLAQVAEGAGIGLRARQLSRNIARMLTFINEKKQAEVQA
ncbi:MAG: 50S ribosomal protein L29 [Planctomycetes bacterium]|nr:50S ribosomal protein L29 [Planctomycetota bacterium]